MTRYIALPSPPIRPQTNSCEYTLADNLEKCLILIFNLPFQTVRNVSLLVLAMVVSTPMPKRVPCYEYNLRRLIDVNASSG